MEKIIAETLKDLYVPQSILGYAYLKTAIMLCLDDPEAINAITKELYPDVAKAHGTTGSKVERAIRHAKEISLYNCPDVIVRKYLQIPITAKATNAHYIAAIAEYIRLNSQKTGVGARVICRPKATTNYGSKRGN